MDYITIADFARQAKVSRQAVYKQLSSKLSEYVKNENGKKLISKDALKMFVNQNDNADVNKNQQGDILLTSVIETLQQQLKAKDEQISALQGQNERLTALMSETLQISKAAQTLQASQMLLDAPPEKKKWGLFRKR